jgi:hypothetical protein
MLSSLQAHQIQPKKAVRMKASMPKFNISAGHCVRTDVQSTCFQVFFEAQSGGVGSKCDSEKIAENGLINSDAHGWKPLDLEGVRFDPAEVAEFGVLGMDVDGRI